MHSLQPNRTIPHPLKPTLLNRLTRLRSRTRKPPRTSLEREPLSRNILRDELLAEGGARGAQEG